jgi:hypothetical protein
MAKPVSPELIQLQAEELQRMTHAAGRAKELAVEVSVFSDAVHDIAWETEETDEPGSFLRHLLAGRRRAGGRS